MAMNEAFYSTWTPRVQALLRIITAYLFITHGSAKLFGMPHVGAFDNLPLFSLIGIAGMIEIVGSVLLLLGLFTRPAAFIMSGEMAFAYFIGHAGQGFVLVPMLNRGELAVLYCFLFLFFAVAGPGAWSVDGLRGRRTVTA
ncbi:MAG TPA: DoxX family protein [Burkholderiales bacterium]|nr:DoxX family protein [Burkholderiales bacterium]